MIIVGSIFSSEDDGVTVGIQYSSVSSSLVLSRKPPSEPGVYMFFGTDDRIMYVGMAHDLEKVLYRYQHLEGRQAMRDRAEAGDIAGVRWLAVPNRSIPPSLESVLIHRYQPPSNSQHNPDARSAEDAVPFTDAEAEWILSCSSRFASVVEEFGGSSNEPRIAMDRMAGETSQEAASSSSTCRDLVLAAMADLERSSGTSQFGLQRIVGRALELSDRYPESTISTHIVSAMCADAPVHHLNHTNDLRRVSRGVYERILR